MIFSNETYTINTIKAAKLLGITRDHLYTLMNGNCGMPFVRFKRSVRFPIPHLVFWVEKHINPEWREQYGREFDEWITSNRSTVSVLSRTSSSVPSLLE